jgi:hypothetical protein
VREFADAAFSYAGLDYRPYVKPNRELYRAAEVGLLGGDASKARRVLGWTHRIGFEELVREMIGLSFPDRDLTGTNLEAAAEGACIQDARAFIVLYLSIHPEASCPGRSGNRLSASASGWRICHIEEFPGFQSA